MSVLRTAVGLGHRSVGDGIGTQVRRGLPTSYVRDQEFHLKQHTEREERNRGRDREVFTRITKIKRQAVTAVSKARGKLHSSHTMMGISQLHGIVI